MKEFFHSTKFKILVCIFALLLGLITYVAVSAGAASIPGQLLETVTRPFVQLSNSISEGVSGFFDKLVNADKYKQENDILREQLSEMYLQIIDYRDIKAENEQLRQILELKEENDELVFSAPCDVIARNANDIYGGFTIDKGEHDGLSLYDPVVTSVGLVGRITEIAPYYSKVSTILSPNVTVGAYCARSKATGVIENDITYAEKGLVLMNNIQKDADLNVGDMIITSGQSGIFPEGMLIGSVTEIFDDDNGLSKHAVIQPIEQLSSVKTTFAITGFKGKGLAFDID